MARDAEEAGEKEEKDELSEAGPNRQPTLATAKLVLQDEDDLRNQRRDVNAVLAQRADKKLQLALEEGVDKHNQAGKEARDKAKDVSNGHPRGKRPDALMKMVLFRASEALKSNEEAMMAAIAQGPDPEATVRVVKTIIEWGSEVQDRDTTFYAARCFVIATEDTEGNMVKKWIFAIMHHRQLHQSSEILRDNGGGRAVGLQFERDSAPRSQAAKKVEKLAFREGKGSKGKGRAKRQKK